MGKSCLVLRFVKGEYSDHLEATIGGTYTMSICMSLCISESSHGNIIITNV